MSIADRINAERLVLAGWPRAILLQVAHPLIAAGVAEHSEIRSGRRAAISRLHGTVRAMLALSFGSVEAHADAIAGIRRIHQRVHGVLATAVGPYQAGTPYSAEDPALLLWVHATLIESVLLAYEAMAGTLTPDERDEYVREAAEVALALGARPADVPTTWTSLCAYLDVELASGRIVVSSLAREIAAAVFVPPMPIAGVPVSATLRLVTRGWLPPVVREQFGWTWTDRDQRRLALVLAALRTGRRLAPRRLMIWRAARRRA